MSDFIRWFNGGGKSARLFKLAVVVVFWYWLVHFLSETFKIAEALTAFAVFFAYINWLRHRKIDNLRRADMDVIDCMSGAEFEQKMLVYFRGVGWKAKAISATSDFGASLILTDPTGRKVFAQCKRCDSPVAVGVVQEAVAAIRYHKVESAMVITTHHLTASAKRLAQVNNVEVWERDKLAASLAAAYALCTPSIWTQLKWALSWRTGK